MRRFARTFASTDANAPRVTSKFAGWPPSMRTDIMMDRTFLSKWICLPAAVSMGTLLCQPACATTVTISRTDAGVVCSGWVVNPGIIATAAHCVLARGHYSVSTAEKRYEVLRIWIHPEFSPELLYLAFFKEEFDHDVAILQIAQRDFSVDVHDYLKDKNLLPGARLFAARAKRSDRQDIKEMEELVYTDLRLEKKGLVVSNNGEGYNICPGDSGTPLIAKIADADIIVGIIVGNAPGEKLRTQEYCGSEIRAIDVSVILQFLESIKQLKR
jgi:hypothetical protein